MHTNSLSLWCFIFQILTLLCLSASFPCICSKQYIYIYIMLSACSLKVHQLPSRYSYSRQNKLRSQQGEDNAMCVCVWVYMYIFYIYIFFSFSDLQTVAWLQRVVLSNGSCPTQRTLTLTAPFCGIKGAIPHIWLQTRKQSDDWRPWY